jgi:hypothetical protein
MGQRVNPDELREMLRVARKLRVSASEAQDVEYTALFIRAAEALEDRAAELAYHPSDLNMPESEMADDEFDPTLYRHVDLRC